MARGLTVEELAASAKISAKQLRRLEKGDVTGATERTVRDLARVLKCEVEVFMVAVDANFKINRDALKRGMNPLTPEAMRLPSGAFKTGVETRHAQREHLMGISHPEIDFGGKNYPLLSFSRIIEIRSHYAELAHEIFAMHGTVRDERETPADVARVLGVEPGRGSSYYIVRRAIPELGNARVPEVLPIAVYVRDSAHHQRLRPILLGRSGDVKMLLRVVWHDVPIFDGGDKFQPWAFLLKTLLTD
jgi:transcriptional regulator with XRE-family HTH domain